MITSPFINDVKVHNDFDLTYKQLLYNQYAENKGFVTSYYRINTENFLSYGKSHLSFTGKQNPHLDNAIGFTTNFPFNRALSAEFSSVNGMTLHSELSKFIENGSQHSLSGGVNSNIEFSKYKGYLNLINGRFEHYASAKYRCENDITSVLYRIIYSYNNFKTGLRFTMDLPQAKVTRYNAFLGWKSDNKEFSIEHISKKARGSKLSELIFGIALQYSHADYVACIKASPGGNRPNFKYVVGISKNINNDIHLQAKIDDGTGFAWITSKITKGLKFGVGTVVAVMIFALHYNNKFNNV